MYIGDEIKCGGEKEWRIIIYFYGHSSNYSNFIKIHLLFRLCLTSLLAQPKYFYPLFQSAHELLGHPIMNKFNQQIGRIVQSADSLFVVEKHYNRITQPHQSSDVLGHSEASLGRISMESVH